MDDWMFEEEFQKPTMAPMWMHQFTAVDQIRQMTQFQWALFAAGIVLFVLAKTIAHKALTFYVSGAVLGVVLSFAFLGMFIRRFLPKRIFMVPIDLLGGPVISFLYYYGYTHAQEILRQNWKWLALYVIVAVTVSLIICYVSDVSSNVRIQNVLQWTLQVGAVLLMLFSSHNVPLASGTVFFILAINWGVHDYFWRFYKWATKKPETRPLLTMREFDDQGAEYTRRELEKLRLSMLDDCRYNSPNKSFTARCSNQDQLASFLMTSQDVSLQSQMDYRKQYGKNAYESDDDESLMDVDSGTDENLLLTDDDY